MAIAPNSESYPVRGAAIAAGDYGDALAWVDAPTSTLAKSVRSFITGRYGAPAWSDFHALVSAAWQNGHLRIRRLGQPDGDAR